MGIGILNNTINGRRLDTTPQYKVYANTDLSAESAVSLTTGTWVEVHTVTIPANTFKKWFKVTFVCTYYASGNAGQLDGVRIGVNNTVYRTMDNVTRGMGRLASIGNGFPVNHFGYFENTDVDFTSAITLDVDWQDDSSEFAYRNWILIEGV